MRRSAPSLVVCSLSILAGAGCERRAPEPAPTAQVPAPTPPPPVEPTAPTAPMVLPEPRDVAITTEQCVIHGTLHPSPVHDAPGVVLVHQLGSSRAEWASLVAALQQAPPLTVLTFDLCGHGESTARPDGGSVSYGDFDAEAWAAISTNVRAAVNYLREDAGPNWPSRIAVVGSSIGATAVVRAAAEDSGIEVFATLSPGRAYRGVDSILVAVPLGPRAYFGIASRDETDSVETAEALARITGGRTEIVDGAAHGVAMLAAHPDLVTHLVTFLRESLAAPPPAPAAEEPPGQPAGATPTEPSSAVGPR